MPTNEEIIIISGFKTKVNYYGWFTVPAWLLIVGPLAIGFVAGAWIF